MPKTLMFHFFSPVSAHIPTRPRQMRIPASFMPVPETTIDKDNRPILPQHDIGMTGQTGMVQPVPESSRKQIFSDYHFRLGILAADSSHTPMTLFFS